MCFHINIFLLNYLQLVWVPECTEKFSNKGTDQLAKSDSSVLVIETKPTSHLVVRGYLKHYSSNKTEFYLLKFE